MGQSCIGKITSIDIHRVKLLVNPVNDDYVADQSPVVSVELKPRKVRDSISFVFRLIEIKVFIQLTNNKMLFISSDDTNDKMNGNIDNVTKGRLINTQNLALDKIASVCIQKNMPLNVKLISPFLIITMM